jgi:AhpD family alkylhydroperoxidase
MTPVPVKQWPAQMRDALSALTPPAPHYDLSSAGRPRAANIMGAMAHHPSLARAFFTIQGHLMRATTLTERHRELVVLRIAALRHCAYVWSQHLFVAADAGLSETEIAWVAWGPAAPVWNGADAQVLRAVDELDRDGVIGDDTWSQLSNHLAPQQILDLIFTAGSWAMLAWMVASLGVELDDDLRDAINAHDATLQNAVVR